MRRARPFPVLVCPRIRVSALDLRARYGGSVGELDPQCNGDSHRGVYGCRCIYIVLADRKRLPTGGSTGISELPRQ